MTIENKVELANYLKNLIDASGDTVSEYREHLGASAIGDNCSRKLWYAFRHAKKNRINGELNRLFNRGHREEPSLIKEMQKAGFVFYHTPEDQQRIEGYKGHFGGSLDNVGKLPPSTNFYDDVIFEFKTMNAAYFTKLKKEGVEISQKKHYAQMCVYGKAISIQVACYVVVNKNDDEIYIEIVELDFSIAENLNDKARAIIDSKVPLAKIANSPSFFSCKWCDFKDICHNGEPMQKNCRTCTRSVAIDGGKWHCELFNQTIPEEFLDKGCDHHAAIGDI